MIKNTFYLNLDRFNRSRRGIPIKIPIAKFGIISFSGIDGSGKTTFAREAKSFLNSKGFKAVIIEVYRNSLYLKIGNILNLFSPSLKRKIGKKEENAKTNSKILFNRVRKFCFYIDIVIFRFIASYYSLRKTIIICDRYFSDSLIHYIFINAINEKEAESLFKLAPRTKLSILCSLDAEKAYNREGGHENINYFKEKMQIYNKFIDSCNFVTLDNSLPLEKTSLELNNLIGNIFSCSQESAEKILMVSRAVEPPWDEASKNLVRDIISHINRYTFYIFATKNAVFNKQGVILERIYTKLNSSFIQKIKLFIFLFKTRKKFSLYHFCFTPQPLTSFIIKNILPKGRLIQNLPCLNGKTDRKSLKKIIYSDIVITNSMYTKKILDNNNIKSNYLIYPSVDTNRFSPNPDTKKKFNLPGGINVLWAGNFTSLSISRMLLSIIQKTCIYANKINFIIASRLLEQRYLKVQNDLKMKLTQNGLRDKVHFFNTIEDMASFISSCDVMIYPVPGNKTGKKIDLPYVIIEALACEKPILIPDIEPLNEITSLGAGLAINGNTADDFSQALETLAANTDLRLEIGRKNREIALRHFDLKENVKKFEHIYQQLLNR